MQKSRPKFAKLIIPRRQTKVGSKNWQTTVATHERIRLILFPGKCDFKVSFGFKIGASQENGNRQNCHHFAVTQPILSDGFCHFNNCGLFSPTCSNTLDNHRGEDDD